jgi:hypothetical protein
MESHTEPAIVLDDDEEVAVTQVIARLRRVGATRERAGSVGDSTDDELLDQFWRRRSGSGHC